MVKEKKDKVKKKEVCETFNVEENGKEKIVESCGIEEEKISTEGQVKKNNETFKVVILVMIGFLAFFFGIMFVNYLMNHFTIDGVEFELDTKSISGTTLYKTSIPVIYDGKKADYNFYFRTDPRKLNEKVNLSEKIVFRKNIVLDLTTENLFCDGDWTIALANLQNLYSLLEINLSAKNESMKYEPASEYLFITINEGNLTEIIQKDENNYDVNIHNCEVLPAFEKLMFESLVQYHELNK